MIHTIGIILTMLYGGALLFSVRSRIKAPIKGQNETVLMIVKVIIGSFMLLVFTQRWLGVIGLVAAIIITFVNDQFILRMISWHQIVIKILGIVVLISILEF